MAEAQPCAVEYIQCSWSSSSALWVSTTTILLFERQLRQRDSVSPHEVPAVTSGACTVDTLLRSSPRTIPNYTLCHYLNLHASSCSASRDHNAYLGRDTRRRAPSRYKRAEPISPLLISYTNSHAPPWWQENAKPQTPTMARLAPRNHVPSPVAMSNRL